MSIIGHALRLLGYAVADVLFVILPIAAVVMETRRTRRLKRWMDSHGFVRAPAHVGPPAIVPGELIATGTTPRCSDVRQGTWAGHPAMACSYSVGVPGGEGETRDHYAVTALELRISEPSHLVRRRGPPGWIWTDGATVVPADGAEDQHAATRWQPVCWSLQSDWLIVWQRRSMSAAALEVRLSLLAAIASGVPRDADS